MFTLFPILPGSPDHRRCKMLIPGEDNTESQLRPRLRQQHQLILLLRQLKQVRPTLCLLLICSMLNSYISRSMLIFLGTEKIEKPHNTVWRWDKWLGLWLVSVTECGPLIGRELTTRHTNIMWDGWDMCWQYPHHSVLLTCNCSSLWQQIQLRCICGSHWNRSQPSVTQLMEQFLFGLNEWLND